MTSSTYIFLSVLLYAEMPEAGVGLMLDFEEDTENGIFVLKFTFPEKWHPQVENYNR